MSVTVTVTQRGSITIPPKIRRKVGLTKGSKATLKIKPDKSVSVRVVEPFNLDRLYGAVDSQGVSVDEALQKLPEVWAKAANAEDHESSN